MDKASGLLSGIQLTYDSNKKGGEYVRKDRESKEKQYIEEEFICKGHASIRSISGTLNPEDKLESLLVTSSDGNSQKFGVAKTNNKHFNYDITADQFPTCVFGSLEVIKEAGKKQYSILEHLGFEIQNQNPNSNSVHINEFND